MHPETQGVPRPGLQKSLSPRTKSQLRGRALPLSRQRWGAGDGELYPTMPFGEAMDGQRSESLIWVGSLTVNQRVTFEIDVDNGWENDDASMKGCYTIVNVD